MRAPTLAFVLECFLAALAFAVVIVLHRYARPAQYEDTAKRYGLKRHRWEPLGEWENRIWLATEARLDTGEALVSEANANGTLRHFPPYERPPMPGGVTWTTGYDFATGCPFVAWLPDDHPIAEAFRKARALQ